MAGEKLRLASLSVLGGSLHGRKRAVEEVVGELLVGSDPDCHLVVDLPSISPIHARLWTDLDQIEVSDTHAPRGVYINTRRVEGRGTLRPGDVLWLGPPQDPTSVCVQCRFEPWVEVLPVGVAEDDAPGAEVGSGEPVSPPAPSEEPAAEADEAYVLEEETASSPPPAEPGEPAQDLGVVAETHDAEPQPAETPEAAPEEQRGGAEEADGRAPAPPSAHPEANSAAAGEAEPFFVGGEFVGDEEPAVPASDEGGERLSTHGEPAPSTESSDEEQPSVAVSPSAEESAGEPAMDEWAISEPGTSAAEPVPATEVEDEFFVADEEPTSVPFEPEVEPARPGSPSIEDAATPSFADFGEFEPEPHTVSTEEPPVPVAPIELEPAWEASAPRPASAAATPAPPAPPVAPPTSPAPAAPVPPPPAPSASPGPASPPAAEGRPAETSRSTETPRPRPVTTIPKRPPSGPSAARGTPAARRPAARPAARRSTGAPAWLRPAALGLAALVVLGAAGYGVLRFLAGRVRVVSVEPARVRVGQRAIVNGHGFASDPSANTVTFDDRPAKVVSAWPERLEVEVPELPVASGGERRVDLVVRAGGAASAGVPVTVIQGPRLHGLSPEAAMPGEEVLLAGAGWGLGATVRFGNATAQIVSVDATSIRAIVPAEAGTPGTSAPVVVTVGGVESNAAPFYVGRVPVVAEVTPKTAAPGDTVELGGLGFRTNAWENDVRIGGLPALVVQATGDSMKVVVPRLPPGDPARTIEVRVPDSTAVGQATLQAAAMPDTVELRFVPEPFTAVPGRPHAVLATGLGPAFLLAASDGKSAGERAVEAAQKLNGALPALRTTLGLTFEARGYDTGPSLGLAGRPDALLSVTEEDAAAYNEEAGARGAPVTRARLARWWEAIARDLVLAIVHGERPRFVAELAPEGRALGQLFDAVRRPGQTAIEQAAVDRSRPALRDAVRLLAFRVPAAVAAPMASAGPGLLAPTAAPTPVVARMPTEGTLRGSENEEGQIRYLSVELRGAGTISYEGGITLTLPLSSLDRGRDRLRFSVPIRGAMRYYSGRWDGEKVAGSISTDAAGRNVVGSFELRPR
jgi:hypothetical protein